MATNGGAEERTPNWSLESSPRTRDFYPFRTWSHSRSYVSLRFSLWRSAVGVMCKKEPRGPATQPDRSLAHTPEGVLGACSHQSPGGPGRAIHTGGLGGLAAPVIPTRWPFAFQAICTHIRKKHTQDPPPQWVLVERFRPHYRPVDSRQYRGALPKNRPGGSVGGSPGVVMCTEIRGQLQVPCDGTAAKLDIMKDCANFQHERGQTTGARSTWPQHARRSIEDEPTKPSRQKKLLR